MCLDSLNWALWVRFHGRYWYQSFIDGSNIWGVDRTDPWGPEMDHPPLGRSYLVGDSCCYMALIIVTCKRNTSAAAKYELYILLPVEQRCSKKCVAALQADTFVCLYIYIYIYIYIYNHTFMPGTSTQGNWGHYIYILFTKYMQQIVLYETHHSMYTSYNIQSICIPLQTNIAFLMYIKMKRKNRYMASTRVKLNYISSLSALIWYQ